MSIEERICRLEREQRRWRLSALCMGAVLLAGAAMGQVGEKAHSVQSIRPTHPDVMTLKRLTVWNGPGTPKIILDEKGLRFQDRKGRTRMQSVITDNDTPVITFYDSKGSRRIASQLVDDLVYIYITDQNGVQRLGLTTSTGNDFTISVYDKKGKAMSGLLHTH